MHSPGSNPTGALAYTSAAGNLTSGKNAGTGTPPPPASAPLTKTLTINQTPDYARLIQDDPAFQLLKQQLSAAGISDAAHLRGAIQQALIQFGAVPDLPPDVLASSGLDTGLTKSLADSNPFSTLTRLKQSYEDQQLGAKNNLAARGILNSGETGYQLGRIGQNQAASQYDATNSLLGNIGTLNDAFAAGQRAYAQQLGQGALTAESNAAAGAPGPTTITATYNAATGTWVDPSGQHYDQNGNAVTLPSSGAYGPTPTTQGGPALYDPSKLLGVGQIAAD